MAALDVVTILVMVMMLLGAAGPFPLLVESGLGDQPPQADVEGHILSAVPVLNTELSRPRWPLVAGGRRGGHLALVAGRSPVAGGRRGSLAEALIGEGHRNTVINVDQLVRRGVLAGRGVRDEDVSGRSGREVEMVVVMD